MDNILEWASAFTIICVALSWLFKGVSAIKATNNEQNKRIEALEQWKAEVTATLDKDKKSIDRLSEEIHLLLKADRALLEHGINGNNIEPMIQSQAEIDDYLIHK